MTELNSPEYPEMKQSITFFILMNLQTNKETKLIEKLYALEEIKMMNPFFKEEMPIICQRL